MTIGDICNLIWRRVFPKRKLKPITINDVPYSEAVKSVQELAKACIKLGAAMRRLEYNGYKNYQNKLRLNSNFK